MYSGFNAFIFRVRFQAAHLIGLARRVSRWEYAKDQGVQTEARFVTANQIRLSLLDTEQEDARPAPRNYFAEVSEVAEVHHSTRSRVAILRQRI